MSDDRLGGALARRPLHLIWILDVSPSMGERGKVEALNAAVADAIPHLRDAASTNPGAELLVRALAFSRSVRWVLPAATPIETFTWRDVEVERKGLTELGVALREVAGQMKLLEADGRGYAPAVILVSDGQPTNTLEPSFRRGLAELMATPWGNKAVRLAVGIGRDADLDALRAFMGHPDLEPLRADNPRELAAGLRWVSTVAVQASSTPNRDVFTHLSGGAARSQPPMVGATTLW